MKYDGYVIYSDLDGTIRNSRGEITRNTREKIEYFQKNGGRFALATGRGIEHSKKLGLKFNAPLICINGTYVTDVDTNQMLAVFEMDSDYRDVYFYATEKYKSISDLILFSEDEVLRLSECGGDIGDFLSKELLKIVYVFENESDALTFQKEMLEKFSDRYAFERSWKIGVEMLSANGGKGNSVEFVRKYYGEKVHTVICAGDFENDISMLRAADIGVAVGNAIESVKEAADVVGPHTDDDAIAWIIDNIETLKSR